MQVRLALESDIDALVEIGKAASVLRPNLQFSEARLRALFAKYLATASPTFFVAAEGPDIAGVLIADYYDYPTFDGHFVAQEVLFVKPEKRGTRAAVSLIRQLIAWAEMLGAKEILGGNDSGYASERIARMLERYGFKRYGFHMRRGM